MRARFSFKLCSTVGFPGVMLVLILPFLYFPSGRRHKAEPCFAFRKETVSSTDRNVPVALYGTFSFLLAGQQCRGCSSAKGVLCA